MPKDAAVVFIAAHGAVSGKGTVIHCSKDYNVIFPTTAGSILELTSHNLILQMLLTHPTDFFTQLQMIESLPSTVAVSKGRHVLQPIQATVNFQQFADIDLGNTVHRVDLMEQINKAVHLARHSQLSWELLEHALTSAGNVLSSPAALTPMNYPQMFGGGDLVDRFLISVDSTGNMQQETLLLCFNCNSIVSTVKSAITTMVGNHQHISGTVSENQLIYVRFDDVQKLPLALSVVLEHLSKIHILVVARTSGNNTVDCIHEDAVGLWSAGLAPDVTNVWDISLPDDTNVIVGACRSSDDSF